MPTDPEEGSAQRSFLHAFLHTPLTTRRTYRLSLTVALALAVSYGMGTTLPYMAPIFALLLGSVPKPPPGPKGLLALIALAAITTGSGLLIVPLLQHYPATAILVVLLALFFSNYLTVSLEKGMVGALLTVGIAMISAVGTLSFAAAVIVIEALLLGIAIAVACLWLVYPFFPENADSDTPAALAENQENALWITLRATLIVMPAYLIALTNPTLYLPLIMKSVSLGQQSSQLDARAAGRTLIGSTAMGGLLAILLWFSLSLSVNLWMFFLWMLLCSLFVASKMFGVSASRYTPDYWMNALLTMLILLGPAVADSANGKDVYQAFAIRISLFFAVTIYAWGTVVLLDDLRQRRISRRQTLTA